MLVAVVDDGINSEMYSIGPLRYDMVATPKGWVRPRKADEYIATMHGTTVAGIVRKYAPDAEFCSIKIFTGQVLQTSCGQLIAALRWCYKRKIPVINLSLGTTEPDDFMAVRKIIKKLLRNRQRIVAACKNDGQYTLPAMHPGVFGVQSGLELSDNEYYINPEDDCIRFIASSSHELTLSNGTTIRTHGSNSYAAPTITAAVVLGKLDT